MNTVCSLTNSPEHNRNEKAIDSNDTSNTGYRAIEHAKWLTSIFCCQIHMQKTAIDVENVLNMVVDSSTHTTEIQIHLHICSRLTKKQVTSSTPQSKEKIEIIQTLTRITYKPTTHENKIGYIKIIATDLMVFALPISANIKKQKWTNKLLTK